MTATDQNAGVDDISRRAMRVLLDELGAVDTMRFLHGVYLSMHGRNSVEEKYRSEESSEINISGNVLNEINQNGGSALTSEPVVAAG